MSALYNEEEELKFLYTKKVTCTNCGKEFEDIRVMTSKLRRKESDSDLRPRFHNFDSLKYGVVSCPYCGFSTPTKNFETLGQLQQRKLREKVTSVFAPREPFKKQVLDYDTALELYQLALICAMSMEVKLSEQAYLCLQISWLIRGKIEEMEAEEGGIDAKEKQKLEEKGEHFYRQAYDGLVQAPMQEDYPICGMDQSTYDYLLAVLSAHYKDYDQAVKYCGHVVQTKGINARLKDKALMLKDDIMAAKKADEETAGAQ